MSYEPIGYIGFGIELSQEVVSELRGKKFKNLTISSAGDSRAGDHTNLMVLTSTFSYGDSYTPKKLSPKKCKMLREGLHELRETFRDAVRSAEINEEVLTELLAEKPGWIMWSAIV